MSDPTVPEPVAKRADQLVVGDRIAHHRLPSTYAEGPGEVVYVKAHPYRGTSWVGVAYVHEDGYFDSTSYRPDGYVEVYPANDPTGLGHSRADDDPETTQPIAGRVPPHYGLVEVAGGLVEVDPPEGFVPASAPVSCRAHGPHPHSSAGGACLDCDACVGGL